MPMASEGRGRRWVRPLTVTGGAVVLGASLTVVSNGRPALAGAAATLAVLAVVLARPTHRRGRAPATAPVEPLPPVVDEPAASGPAASSTSAPATRVASATGAASAPTTRAVSGPAVSSPVRATPAPPVVPGAAQCPACGAHAAERATASPEGGRDLRCAACGTVTTVAAAEVPVVIVRPWLVRGGA